MSKTLVVTNDFPPRRGGIQSFVHGLASRLPAGSVVVYAPSWDGAAEFDARQPMPVIRHPTSLLLPVPPAARRAVAALEEHGCDSVLFGAAAPLGLVAPAPGELECGFEIHALLQWKEAGGLVVSDLHGVQRRHLLGAPLLGLEAAGSEPAA